METSGFVFLFIFEIIIMVPLYLNYIVSCTCRDNFTNTVPVSYVCPYGGNLIYNNKYCSGPTAAIDPTTKLVLIVTLNTIIIYVQKVNTLHQLFVQTDIRERVQGTVCIVRINNIY